MSRYALLTITWRWVCLGMRYGSLLRGGVSRYALPTITWRWVCFGMRYGSLLRGGVSRYALRTITWGGCVLTIATFVIETSDCYAILEYMSTEYERKRNAALPRIIEICNGARKVCKICEK